MPERPARARLLLLAARLLRRDLASGRLVVMLLAAIVAVASTTSINLLVTRVERAMLAESSALLAGDLAIGTRDPTPPRYAELARTAGLETARTVSMRSVVAAGEALQLVRLKAVDDAYPLRGELQLARRVLGPVVFERSGPPPGEAWADARLFQLLDLAPGDRITVGERTFPLTRVVVLEPDRGGDVFTLAPRVMINLADLASTGLVLPGTRASYQLLISGPATALEAFRAALDVPPGVSVTDPSEARPEMRAAFAQAGRFLALAAFAGVLLATIGIALAASAYAEHHEQTIAIVRTLGLTSRETRLLLGAEIVLLAVLAAALGSSLAWLVHNVLLEHLLPASAAPLTAPPWSALAHGAWASLVVLAGFALPALMRLTRLPVVAVLNRDRTALPAQSMRTVLAMILATALIAPWHIDNARLVALAFAGMMSAALVLAVTALVLVRALGRLRTRTRMTWRFGLASIARRARLSVVQTTAIGLGIAVILLLALVRGDLLGQWQARLPADAPNQFLINIQGDEVDSMRAFLRDQAGVEAVFYPMVRGRLRAIGATPVEPDAYADPRSRRLADREFNLSWATHMKADNRLVAGRWWPADAVGEMSVERGIAERLGIILGDMLEFSVAEQRVRGRVTSLREVEWDNFEVNFFVVTTPELLAGTPATWITSFHLPRDGGGLMARLVERFPSVTVIDVDALMRQVRQVMGRVAAALSWVFGFALAAGVLVLLAAVQASQRERVLDVVLLKTLGASRRFVTLATLTEFALIGLIAGLLGSTGAVGTGWLLAEHVFDMPYLPDWRIPLAGIVSGVLAVGALGVAVARRTHRQSVVASLRASA